MGDGLSLQLIEPAFFDDPLQRRIVFVQAGL
jgi:hypothetical protein